MNIVRSESSSRSLRALRPLIQPLVVVFKVIPKTSIGYWRAIVDTQYEPKLFSALLGILVALSARKQQS